ncbi:MAG: 2-phospho-L-lactate guanylyltransferase [Anaerolineae bacterium]|nr:2-phospho-L-lactate guanylyltransferase [Anaerolineae bacterium]
MSIWAMVPIKPLNRAKSRLSSVLSSEQRETLALYMLMHNLEILTHSAGISGVLVISRDMKALAAARAVEGVHTLQESGTPELNKALHRASRMLMSWGTTATLILPADIPLLSCEDVQVMIDLGRFEQSLVIAPDRYHDGTNAMFMRPPDIIDYGFGRGSFNRHVQAAELAGAEVHRYESERLSLDVDSPEDLILYQQLAAKLGEPVIDFLKAAPHV